MARPAATSVPQTHTRRTLLLVLASFAFAVAAVGQEATGSIGTDKLDYMPGEVVSIFGHGWAAGETVTMVLHEEPVNHADRTLISVADENGRFTNTDFVPEDHDKGVRFLLTASGATSGMTTSTDFFDGTSFATSGTSQDYTVAKSSGATIVHNGTPTAQSQPKGDDQSKVIPLPSNFNFRIYGQLLTNAAVSTNGLLQFGSNSTSGANHALFGVSPPDSDLFYTIAPYWDDLSLGGNNDPLGVFTSTSGASPNRIFNIEWRGRVGDGSQAPLIGFEVRLYETTNVIEFIYDPTKTFSGYGASATIGIVRTTASNYTQWSNNEAGQIAPGDKLTFTPGTDSGNDITPPSLTVPANITAEATGAAGAVVNFTATATDAIDGNITPVCTPASGSTFALGTTTVSCVATDKSNNSSAPKTFTVTIRDTTPPTISVSGLDANKVLTSNQQVVSYTATGTDVVDGNVTVTCSPVSGSTFAFGSTPVNCSAKDKANNTATFQFTVKVADGVAPVLTLPLDITKEAEGPTGAVVTFTTSATDDVDGTIPVTCDHNSGATYALGTTVVNCSAKDKAGNEAKGSFNIKVQDTVAPTLTVPTVAPLEATGPGGATVAFSVTASDVVDPNPKVTCDHTSGSKFPVGDTTVSCTAEDASGNKSTAKTFVVTVTDHTPPEISQPPDITKEGDTLGGSIVNFTITVHDLVDPDPKVTCDHTSGSKFPVGDTTVSCTAEDASGNKSAAKTFKVTVTDTTPPTLPKPADITKEGDTLGGAHIDFAATAHDIVDGDITPECDHASGSLFAVGTVEVKCTAKDKAGNSASTSFNVTVTDKTPPSLTLPSDQTLEATGPGGAVSNFNATAHDIVDGDVTVACTPASGTTFAITTTTVQCSAVDKSSNKAEGSFKVTVQDTTPPALTLPGDITQEATGPFGAPVTFATSATDLVDGSVTLTCLPASGSTFPLGTTPVTCSAKDAHGNSASGGFNVKVQDTTPPALTLPGPLTAIATRAQGAAVQFSTSATDIVSGVVPVTCSVSSGSTFAPGTTQVTCSATDQAGKTATGSFTVTVTFAWSGFLQPINMDNSSVFKLGSTVPVKFQLIGASAGIPDLVAKIYVAKVSNSVVGQEMEAISTSAATTGNLFRCGDPGCTQYIFNWGTKGLSTGTYQIRVDMGDGVATRTVLVSLR